MKNKKRIKAAFLALMLCTTLLFTACKSSNSSGTSNTGASDSGKTEEPVTISINTGYVSPQVDQQKVQDAINEYLQKDLKVNVNLELNFIEGWDEKSNLMISSGEEFDIMFTAGWFKYSENVAKGAFLPLDDLIDKNAPKLKETVTPEWFDGTRVDGKIYAVPTMKEKGAQDGVVLNKSLVEKYKIDVSTIKSAKDLEPYLALIKEKEPDYIPWWGEFIYQIDYIDDYIINGLISYKDGKAVPYWELPEVMEGFRTAHDWYTKGYINSNIMENPQQALGGFFAGWAMLKPGKDKELSAAYEEDLVQAGTTEVLTRTGDLQGSMMAISRTSKHPEMAIKILELMNTDKTLNNMINFGIEGVHYKKVSDNIITKTDATPNYSPGGGWIFQNQFLNYLWDTEDPNKWEEFEKFNDSARISPILGFVFDPSNVETEIAAINNIMEQYRQVQQGVIDPDVAVPEAMDKCYKAGLQNVLDEANKQLDAFFAAQKK